MDRTILEREYDIYKKYESDGFFANKKIYVGPVNEYSRYFISLLLKDGYKIENVFDRDPSKKNKKIFGINIVHVEDITFSCDNLYCIASRRYDEIFSLVKTNVGENVNVIKCVDFFSNDYKNMYKKLPEITQEIRHAEHLFNEILRQRSNKRYLIFPYNSIGDIFILGLYKNHIEKYYGEYILLLFGKSSGKVADICKLKYKLMSEYDIKCLIRLSFIKEFSDKLLVLHFNYASTSVADGLCYFNDISLIDLYSKIFFHNEKPDLTLGQQIFNVGNHMRRGEGGSVLLAPFAKSVRDLPVMFWEELAFCLKQKNYKVYTNCAGNLEEPIYGTERLSLDFKELADFLNEGNCMIALRSGLCDVMGLTYGVKIILYANEMEHRLFNLKYLESDSISEMVYIKKQEFCMDVIERMERMENETNAG